MKNGGFTLRKWKTNDKELALEVETREEVKSEEPLNFTEQSSHVPRNY